MRGRFAIRSTAVLAALLAGSVLLAAAVAPHIDAARSSITATFKQSGVPVDAQFKRFSGNIVYDPTRAAAATAMLEVQTGSLDIGTEEYNAEIRKKSWLDSASYPKAIFVSRAIKPLGPGRFSATGTLTMKGKVQTITVPISVKALPDGSAFDGAFTLSRRAWAIGEAAWDEVLEDAVVVRFHLISNGN